jgi:ABC-type nitrate/sulfonate/bicarbonate transport system permease component
MKGGWRLASLAFAAGLVGLWQLAADHGLISRVFFPAPSRAFDVLGEWAASGELWRPLAGTVWRTLAGWLGATALGVVLGAAIASSALTRDLFEPTVEFLRPLPSSAMIPPAILLLGLTDGMVVAVVIFGSIWPILLGAIHGFRSVEPRLVELARTLRLGRWRRLSSIALPNALPEIFAGMRVSLAIALIITVVAEMLSSRPGLGQMILFAARGFRSAEIFAGVFLLGAIGYLGNLALERAEAYFLRWRPAIGVA